MALLRPDSDRGYRHFNRITAFLFSVFNFLLALFFLLLTSPVFFVLALIIRLKDGGPIIYRGIRLGRQKKPFTMYKFRTLPVDYERRHRGKLFSEREHPIPRWARFMRETRLDELPQLVNILKRDMDFMGPRPIRPEVYESCKHLKNYDKRFLVRPGLIGFSQLFTPHSSTKRIRSKIDNRLLQKKYSVSLEVQFIALAMWTALTKMMIFLRKYTKDFLDHKVMKKYAHVRNLDRFVPSSVHVQVFAREEPHPIGQGNLIDVNDLYLKVETEQPIRQYRCRLILDVVKKDGRRKRICVSGKLWRIYRGKSDRRFYVFRYWADTPFQQYLIDQYLLGKSLFHKVRLKVK